MTITTLSPEVDRKSHSYLLGLAEASNEHLRDALAELVACVKDDLGRLPEGYRARRALDRAQAALTTGERRDG